MPKMMTKWQAVACAEAQRAQTIASSFGTRTNRTKLDPVLSTQSVTTPPQVTHTPNDVVPMEPHAQLNKVSTSPCAVNPTTQNILCDALALSPQERLSLVNNLAFIDDYSSSPAAQINNLAFASPDPQLPLLPPVSRLTPQPPLPYLSSLDLRLSPHPPSPAAYLRSPLCTSHVLSRTPSPAMSLTPHPISHPLWPAVLSSLALRDKTLPLPDVIDLCDDDNDDADIINLCNDDDDGADFPATSPILSLSHIADDTTLLEGVKTSPTSVSMPLIDLPCPNATYYPTLFLPRALERPRDPDKVEPITLHHHTSTPCPNSPAPRIATVPPGHPLREHARKKRKREYNANNEEPYNHLVKQLVTCTTPLPKFKKYRCRPTIRKCVPPKNQQMPSHCLKPGEKPKTTDSAEPPAFNAILQHVFY
ncbi:hypothetical protein EDB92DRAFT_1944487 [Lactarius akahatsu]|uniref:Uncharacterized protein n=1 Tax=Lactarius akahatsu TaxID=416441 RepID=A0AAD4LJ39_9AGAM|nr:hypothetical protein EDB92DRAFT_1944487 [Lactarius akahatsu]